MFGYGVVAIGDYTDSEITKKVEIWMTLGVFATMQVGSAVVGRIYGLDTIMYLVSEEMKELCDKFGLLCNDYGIMTPENYVDGSL